MNNKIMNFKSIIFIFTLIFPLYLNANEYHIYNGSHMKFKHPKDFKVTSEIDSEGYKEIFIEGPGRTSVFITITPETGILPLDEFSEQMRNELKQKYNNYSFSNQEIKNTSVIIHGEEIHGIIDTYTLKRFFIGYKASFTHYILTTPKHIFIISNEMRGKFIQDHEIIVSDIISSIEIKDKT